MLKENSQLDTDSLSWSLAKQVQGKLQEETFWKTKDIEKNAKAWNASLSQAAVTWVAANSDVTSVQVNQVFLESEENVTNVLGLLKSWSQDKEDIIRNAAKNEPEIQCDKSLTWAQYQKLSRRRDLAVKFTAQEEMEWEPSQATGEPAAHGYDYDIFIIGGGSGGISTARWAGTLGKKVAVADFVKPSPAGTKWGLGGTCVNVGCIPKKLMHYAGLLNESKEEMKNAGVSVSEEPHSWKTMVGTVNKHIKTLNWGYKTEILKAGGKYFNMYAKLVDPHTIFLDDGKKQLTVTADKIVIACGGRPTYPDIPGAKEFGISSDDIFWKKEAPGKTLVVGASYVALECAGFLHAIGYDTTVMVRSILLRGFDQDMANLIGKHMEENGTKFIQSAVPEKLEKNEEGRIVVTYQQSGESKQEVYDTVLFAIGRTACTQGMDLEKAGIVPESNGKLKVNNQEQTTQENIYAVGDVVYGMLELTPVAIKAGKLLAYRLFGGATDLMDYEGVPTTVFTPIEYGCCGLSEADAIKKFGDANIDVYHQQFKPLEWSYNKKRLGISCYVKVIVNHLDDERIVGFHILCPNAGDITQGVGIAMKGPHFNKEQLDSCVGIHPVVAEDIIGLDKTKREEPDATKGSC